MSKLVRFSRTIKHLEQQHSRVISSFQQRVLQVSRSSHRCYFPSAFPRQNTSRNPRGGTNLSIFGNAVSDGSHLLHVNDSDGESNPRVGQGVVGALVRRGDIGFHLGRASAGSGDGVRLHHGILRVQDHHIDHGLFTIRMEKRQSRAEQRVRNLKDKDS